MAVAFSYPGAQGDQFASMLKNMDITLPGIDEASTFAHIVKCVPLALRVSGQQPPCQLLFNPLPRLSPPLTVLRMTKTMDFDVVVFDTAPTGHTLRLLQMPESISKVIDKFLQLNTNMGGMLSQVGAAVFLAGAERLGGSQPPGDAQADGSRSLCVPRTVDERHVQHGRSGCHHGEAGEPQSQH